jgi:hypothetical protein
VIRPAIGFDAILEVHKVQSVAPDARSLDEKHIYRKRGSAHRLPRLPRKQKNWHCDYDQGCIKKRSH